MNFFSIYTVFGKIFKKLSGNQYRRYIKSIQPMVDEINRLEVEFQKLTDEELQAKTPAMMERHRQAVEEATKALGPNVSADKISEAELAASKKILDEMLPEAFAVCKNGARRLCGRTEIVCGNEQTWDMVHFDVQLIGGIALHQNKIAEMATGEGKTLVATLPLYLNALTGRNCQLVTVNDYLARRDSEWMGFLFKFLGLTVGCIQNSMTPPERREAYGCNITYGTASEFGFDYLRDNGMASRVEDQVQSDYYFVIIDEVDQVLVDEARTPLIISGPAQITRELPFNEMKPAIEKLVRQQTALCNELVTEAKEALDKGDVETGLIKLYQCKLGTPKNKQLLRLMQDGTLRKNFDKFETELHGDFNKEKAVALKEELFYTIDEKQHHADLSEKGRNFLKPNNPDAFLLPDLPTMFMEIEKHPKMTQDQKDRAKAEAQNRFEVISEEIHCISQLLRAYSVYERDVNYMVHDGKVMIIDENTGRAMPGRRWSDGLHQAVEAKEGVDIERETKTYATITIQNYFRLYDKLAGMTGTAETEANEFRDIYKLDILVVPTNRPIARSDEDDTIFKTRREKYNAVIEEIQAAHKKGQPVLVGTASVEASEVLSRMLRRTNIRHSVLNARYHQQEAEIIARAGHKGAVTIATNMAGRGTDIKLGEGVKELGGLYVIGTERHSSRRTDRQLRGRSGRQGDPGRSRFYISLEDDLLRLFGQTGMVGKLLEKSVGDGAVPLPTWVVENAQKRVEEQNYSIRKRLLQYDDVLNKQREVIYDLRNDALATEEPREIIWELIEEELDNRIDEAGIYSTVEEESEGTKGFLYWVNTHFPIKTTLEEIQGKRAEEVRDIVAEKIKEAYQMKESVETPEALKAIERFVIIGAIDRNWQDHLTEMEDLRQSVGLRGYGQKDPLVEYKNEAFTFFNQMMGSVRSQVASGVFRHASNVEAFQGMMDMLNKRRVKTSGPADAASTMQPQKAQLANQAASVATASAPAKSSAEIELPKIEPRKPKIPSNIGRNDVVVIAKGNQQQEVKFKKALPLIENEGWQLVGRK